MLSGFVNIRAINEKDVFSKNKKLPHELLFCCVNIARVSYLKKLIYPTRTTINTMLSAILYFSKC
jgi:hypothetical protein